MSLKVDCFHLCKISTSRDLGYYDTFVLIAP